MHNLSQNQMISISVFPALRNVHPHGRLADVSELWTRRTESTAASVEMAAEAPFESLSCLPCSANDMDVAMPIVPSSFLVVGPGAYSSFLLLVVGPGAPSSFLLVVARPGAPSSVLARSSEARSP